MSEQTQDHDPDSQMQSSSSETEIFEDDDSLFPDISQPLTPSTRNKTSQDIFSTDLSPPGSQIWPSVFVTRGFEIPESSTQQAGVGDNAATQAGKPSAANTEGAAAWEGRHENVPGWGWKNPKAQDEMKKAIESLLDRDFDPYAGLTDPLLGDRNFSEELEKYKRREF